MIKRTKYLNKILTFIDKPLIKALVGMRRSGKTVLLTQIKDELLQRGIEQEQIIFINFESYAYKKYLDGIALYQYIIETATSQKGKRIYLFFDEIQNVNEWEKIVSSLLVDINCDIYIAGSSTKLLSGELATHITDHHVRFDIYPFTFAECKQYAQSIGRAISDEQLFAEYIQFGGLPQCCALPDKHSKLTYLEDVFNSIVINDIIKHNNISDIDLLKRIIIFLSDNMGKQLSSNYICKNLNTSKNKTTVSTTVAYLSAILKSLVIGPVKRYDTKNKAIISTNQKYYSTDLGICNHINSSEAVSYSKLFENVVYLELLSRGYQVNVGKVGDHEIDFICYNRNKEKIYIQVAYMLTEQSAIEREFKPFSYVKDNYPKYIISADKVDLSRDGIHHFNIIDFLLLK